MAAKSKKSAGKAKKSAKRPGILRGPKGRSGGAGTPLTSITLTDNSGNYGSANTYLGAAATGVIATTIQGPGTMTQPGSIALPVSDISGITWARAAIWATKSTAAGPPVILTDPITTSTAGFKTLTIVVQTGTGKPTLTGTT